MKVDIFLSVGGATKVDSLEVNNNITMNGDTITSTNSHGITIFKNTLQMHQEF